MEQQDQQMNNIQQQQPLQQVFKVKGMKTDLSESSFENEFAFENKNIRINVVDEDNTLMNLTNERGTKFVDSIQGIPIGLKKYDYNKALLFTTNNEGSFNIEKITTNEGINNIELQETNSNILFDFNDHIYKLEQQDKNIKVEEIGTLIKDTNFSAVNPLEIESYKDGNKDYFYIADGINNFKSFCLQGSEITSNFDNIDNKKQQHLDYNCKIDGNESITVKSIKSSNGEFFAGTIIYCFSYITYQGHKTGIIDITNEVLAIKNHEQNYGLEPNKRANIANAITVNGLSNSFKEIEIYSLFRATLNGEIIVRKVCELPISNNRIVYFTDLNQGEIISYQELLTRFNSVLIPSTITQKSGALFLGNIKTNNYENLKNLLLSENQNYIELTRNNNQFLLDNQYFYGIQLQDVYGNWSPVIYTGTESEVHEIKINAEYQNKALQLGYIAIRAMLLDNKRIRNTICEGVILPTFKFENGKYGIDYYSPYFADVKQQDIYSSYIISSDYNCPCDIYSPDIEFDENFIVSNEKFNIYQKELSLIDTAEKIDITITGNTGVLYNNTSTLLGKTINEKLGEYYWIDAITGYQKALQIIFEGYDCGSTKDDEGTDFITSLYKLNELEIKEEPVEYKIYVWQPSGSLNDSDGKTSVLKNKRISRVYSWKQSYKKYQQKGIVEIANFDCTTNNIPIIQKNNNKNEVKVYGGIINEKVYQHPWDIPIELQRNKSTNGSYYWDDEQITVAEGFAIATLPTVSFIGQPIEFNYSYNDSQKTIQTTIFSSARWKAVKESTLIQNNRNKTYVRVWRGGSGTSIGSSNFGQQDNWVQEYWDKGWSLDSDLFCNEFNYTPLRIRVTNNHNRSGAINMTYKTAKHIVVKSYHIDKTNEKYITKLVKEKKDVKIQKSEIETGQWIICSKKVALNGNKNIYLNVDINDSYVWQPYECLKTEPYSLNDENQVTCVLSIQDVNSYINPMCRYDNLRNLSDYNGVTSAVFNKLNMVYNQKNNFFIFGGITEDTITDDNLEHTILYSDMKLANEKEDSFVNFDTTNFYTIDSNISKINKLITYNDKLLCFSDNAISQILYNENVVINTDSVQSLGLASTDKVTGSQILSNTFGCMNKWSMGIYNNVLFFNDDLNNKMIAYSGEFDYLNETLNIETLNSKFLKKSVWNPVYWGNTKLNIDSYAKDVHYTTNDTDIALNQTVGNFTSLYSYEKIPYMETLGDYSIAVRNLNRNESEVYLLRQGDYNHFFGKFEPYWTTIIVNQNSLINKMISNLEFSTEAYDNNMLPVQNFTFDHIEFWNDYQSNKMAVNYKLYGQSLLKKKFRVWRINHFRNSTKLIKRNYDMMSNTWHYLKLSTENENSNKLTLHWLNLNYR